MLGEKIADETNKTTSQRVLSVEGGLAKMETTAQGKGTMLGVDYHSQVTYTGQLRADGTLFGEGKGIMMGKGGEAATFVASGVGKFTQSGGVSWRGAFFFQSGHAKWTRLNSIATMFEYEVDAEGNGKGSLHEWR